MLAWVVAWNTSAEAWTPWIVFMGHVGYYAYIFHLFNLTILTTFASCDRPGPQNLAFLRLRATCSSRDQRTSKTITSYVKDMTESYSKCTNKPKVYYARFNDQTRRSRSPTALCATALVNS